VGDLEKLGMTGLAWLILAVGGGLVCLGLWLTLPRGARLFPWPRWRPVPWTGLEVAFAIAVMSLVPGILYDVLNPLGVFNLLYGEGGNVPARQERQRLCVQALALPIQVALILGWLAVAREVRPAGVGLGGKRFAQNVIAGYLLWLALAVPVLFLNAIVSLLFKPEQHFLEQVGQFRLFDWEWAGIVFLAVIAAPVLEELVFRGVLLPWQLSRSFEEQLVVGLAALTVAVLFGARESGFNPGPMVFTLAMLPGYVLLPYLYRYLRKRRHASRPEGVTGGSVPGAEATPPQGSAAWRLLDFIRLASEKRVNLVLALYGNALLFAAFHSAVWPTPIALFVLGLGLGWLAYRTRSLVGPIVVHLLFNGVATLYLFLT
jgi:membrane protease YdiL (CAAX protease family)